MGDSQVKGQGIYAYVTLVEGVTPSDKLKKEIMDCVRKEVSVTSLKSKYEIFFPRKRFREIADISSYLKNSMCEDFDKFYLYLLDFGI